MPSRLLPYSCYCSLIHFSSNDHILLFVITAHSSLCQDCNQCSQLFPPPSPSGETCGMPPTTPQSLSGHLSCKSSCSAKPIIVIWKFHFSQIPLDALLPLCVTDCRQLLLQLSLNCRSSHTSLHFSISFYVFLCVFQQFRMNVRILELSLNCCSSRTFLQLRCVGGSLNLCRENSFLSKFKIWSGCWLLDDRSKQTWGTWW